MKLRRIQKRGPLVNPMKYKIMHAMHKMDPIENAVINIHICILVRANIDSLNVEYNLNTKIPKTQQSPMI